MRGLEAVSCWCRQQECEICRITVRKAEIVNGAFL